MTHRGHRPPRWAELLVERSLASRASRHGVLGDMEEEFRRRRRTRSATACNLWYWSQAVSIWWRFRSGSDLGGPLLGSFGQEARIAARGMRRRPGFAAAVIVTIALGIGGATTMFTVVHGILVDPLPYRSADRLVAVWPEHWASHAFLMTLERHRAEGRLRVFDALGAYAPRIHVVQEAEGAREIPGPRVSVGFLEVLDPAMPIGRIFARGEDTRGSDDVVVLTDAYWQEQVGRERSAIGSSLDVGGMQRTVVGVLPPGFDVLQAEAQMVVPQNIDPTDPSGSQELKLIGRLRSDVPLEQANREFYAYSESLRDELALPADWNRGADLVPLQEWLVGDLRPTLLLLLGSAALLLVIAATNVASLFVARTMVRQGELSVRRALGASRARVVRLLWTESMVLGLFGAGLGVVIAWLGVPILGSLLAQLAPESLYNVATDGLPRLGDVAVDGPVVLFSVLLGVAVGAAAGFPGLRLLSEPSLGAMGTRGAPGGAGRMAARARRALVAAEVALAVVLIAASGVLAKSLSTLSRVDPGFRAEGLLAFTVVPDRDRWRPGLELHAAFEELTRSLAALPGVTDVTTGTDLPLAPTSSVSVTFRTDAAPPEPGSEPVTQWRAVSPEYFEVLAIPLLRGRAFLETDTEKSEDVVVLSSSAAALVFGDDDPLGRPVQVGMEGERQLTVVGVVGDIGEDLVEGDAPPLLYRPWPQAVEALVRFGRTRRGFVVRTASDPLAVAGSVGPLVRQVDRRALVRELRSVSDVVASTRSRPRAILTLVAFFTSVAVALAGIGMFGVVAYLARQRRRELAIRLALGAGPRHVRDAVLSEGLRIAAIGVTVGLALSTLAVRALRRFVFEIDVTDPAIILGAGVLAGATALAASSLPAWRAGRASATELLEE